MTPALRATVADVTRHRCGPSHVVVQAEGNAIPPKMAQAVACGVLEALEVMA